MGRYIIMGVCFTLGMAWMAVATELFTHSRTPIGVGVGIRISICVRGRIQGDVFPTPLASELRRAYQN